MTAGFTSNTPCLVCAMQHTNGGENERGSERGGGEGGEGEGEEIEYEVGMKREERGKRRERQRWKSEEEREDIDRTSSRATRPPLPCQASWKERSLNPDFSFSAPRVLLSFFNNRVFAHDLSCPLCRSLSFSLPFPLSSTVGYQKKHDGKKPLELAV